jgi:hypothetical protein
LGVLVNYFANSISSCGSASLAAVTSETRQTKSCEADFSQRPGEGTQPSGYERLQTKKLQTVLVDQEIFLLGGREGVYSSL